MDRGACRSTGLANPTQYTKAEGERIMKNEDVQVGETYLAKVGARSVEVSIERENSKGGWDAKSLATGKPVRVKDATHLKPAKAADQGTGGPHEGDGGDVATRPAKRAKGSAKPKREKKPAADKPAKAMSCLDAAAAVLKAKGEPLACRAMIDSMREQGLWTSDAPTPHATLFSALLREIKTRGTASRFKKGDRGHFTLNEQGS
jgi:hypothetical protein